MKNIVKLLLFILLTSCNENDDNKKYSIINKVIDKHKQLVNEQIITNSDTFSLRKFIIDPKFCKTFEIDTSNGDYLIKYQGLKSDSLSFNRIFESNDLSHVKTQTLMNIGNNIKIDKLNNNDISDYSLCNSFDRSYRLIWHNTKLIDDDYLILSSPIFNKKNDLATICTSLYSKNKYVGSIYELHKIEKEWKITNCYSVVIKFVEEKLKNNRVRIYTVVQGFSAGKCF